MKISEARARAYGEVLTPTWLVAQILTALRVEDTRARVLDLCCGPGAFLRGVLDQRLASLPTDAPAATLYALLQNLYGIDLLADNVDSCRADAMQQVRAWASRAESAIDMTRVAWILRENITQGDALGQLHIACWQPDGITVQQEPVPGFFDTIISNPPYQRSVAAAVDRNRSKAVPLYHRFFDLARELQPRQMGFVMPAKWYTGGWGLDSWRQSVLAEGRVAELHDYRDSKTVFPTAEVNGGICWLIWRHAHVGNARIVRHDRAGRLISDLRRPLLEAGADFFVRDEAAASILHRVGSFTLAPGARFSDMILATTPFGMNSNFADYRERQDTEASLLLYYIKERELWVTPRAVTRNARYVPQWKIFFPVCHNQHSRQIIGQPRVFGPGSTCTHSYLAVCGFDTAAAAASCRSYMMTKFFRFLVGQLKISPIATRQAYRLVPVQAWDRQWSDEQLYDLYSLNATERALIEATVSAMV